MSPFEGFLPALPLIEIVTPKSLAGASKTVSDSIEVLERELIFFFFITFNSCVDGFISDPMRVAFQLR